MSTQSESDPPKMLSDSEREHVRSGNGVTATKPFS